MRIRSIDEQHRCTCCPGARIRGQRHSCANCARSRRLHPRLRLHPKSSWFALQDTGGPPVHRLTCVPKNNVLVSCGEGGQTWRKLIRHSRLITRLLHFKIANLSILLIVVISHPLPLPALMDDQQQSHKVDQENDKEKIIAELTRANGVLKANISTLYRTARAEIARKNERLAELQAELDDLLFKRKERAHISTINQENNVTQLTKDDDKKHR